ncbi:MAG: hypothetical protein K8F91_10180 [Candidatus Obscuribacterales bacterium]|nr:hypothetical protein [Candidatus Obscuribacterales bacterium]
MKPAYVLLIAIVVVLAFAVGTTSSMGGMFIMLFAAQAGIFVEGGILVLAALCAVVLYAYHKGKNQPMPWRSFGNKVLWALVAGIPASFLIGLVILNNVRF